MSKTYKLKQVLDLFGANDAKDAIVRAEEAGEIPKSTRVPSGAGTVRTWNAEELPAIGGRFGFLPRLKKPTVLTVFTTKGGVLKTTLALNIARLAALHDIRTLVVGLDLQCDVTSALGIYQWDAVEDLSRVIKELEDTEGLYSLVHGDKQLGEFIRKTDLPTLDVVPETAELATLDRWISTQPRREYWLKDKVVQPVRDQYDLIVFDCSPNWSQLISSAIVASDLLISPIECHINQFRNLNVFRELAREFKVAMKLEYEHLFVPTRFVSSQKLSGEIRGWYLANVPNVTEAVVRESVQGEEAMASHVSIPEYAPTSPAAAEIRTLMGEIWARIGSNSPVK